MKIYVLGRVLEYENDVETIDIVLEELKKIIEKSNCILSYLEIDGQNIYDNFQHYLKNNIETIEEVKVVVKTIIDVEKEMLQEVEEYFEKAIPEIEMLSYEFFKGPTEKDFIKLAKLLKRIRWIIDVFELIDSNYELRYIVSSYEIWNFYAKDIFFLQEIIEKIKRIFDEDELDSIPEILHNAIIPLFNDMQHKLDILICRKVDESELN